MKQTKKTPLKKSLVTIVKSRGMVGGSYVDQKTRQTLEKRKAKKK